MPITFYGKTDQALINFRIKTHIADNINHKSQERKQKNVLNRSMEFVSYFERRRCCSSINPRGLALAPLT